MAKNFNGWILQATFKYIISILEEIRVHVIERIRKMREFVATWISNISSSAMERLEKNKFKSMECIIKWNGDNGFEVED